MNHECLSYNLRLQAGSFIWTRRSLMILIQGVQAKVAKINYTPAEYRNILRMTRRTHLLVEGKMDKRFFSTLIDEWRQEDLVDVSTSGFDIDIDTAETLIEFLPPLGNREKVEIICQEVAKTDYAVRLVGFCTS